MATTTTIKAGESAKTITLHEGKTLTLTGSTGAVGVVYQLDLVLGGTNSVKSWAVGSGALPQIGPFSGAQMFQLTCTAGSIDATVGDAVLGAPQFSPNGANLVNPAGQKILLVGKYNKVLYLGNSITALACSKGLGFNGQVNITGVLPRGASLNWPTGGPSTMRFVKATGMLSIQAFGDTEGPGVDISKGGCFTLTSGNPLYVFPVDVKYFYLPATSQNDTLTPAASAQWTRAQGGWPYVVEALTYKRFTTLPLLGISGDQLQFMLNSGGRLDQAIAIAAADGSTVLNLEILTNDLQLSPQRTDDQMVADATTAWDRCALAGVPVIHHLIAPRWGRDLDGTNGADVAKYTAALEATRISTNRKLVAAAKTRPYVFIVDTNAKSIDATQATGRVKDGWTLAGDGLHPGAAMSIYGYATEIVRILNILSPGNNYTPNIGAASYYNASTNPGGNKLAPNVGAFAGTGGINNAGVTIGTGLAALMTAGHAGPAGAMTAVANKVAADDHGADWQEFVISGATVLNEQLGLYFPTVGNTKFVAGSETVGFGLEVRIIGTGCYGVFAKCTVTGATYAIQANQFQNVAGGLDNISFYLAAEDYPIPAGVTAFDWQIYTQSLIGGSFKVQFRSASFAQVPA